MALITNTRTITYANACTDTKQLVTCKDVLGIATRGTDFIFDPLNVASYPGSALPAVGATPGASRLLGALITNAGSGGTNGTFALNISGGGGSGAAGTFTVAGGSLTDITITNGGSGYTSSPAFNFSASAGLTGVAASAQIGNMLNLARDKQPALARTKGVILSPFTAASQPTFDGKGLASVNGTTTALNVQKVGVLNGKVCEPYHEGFIDFVEIVVAKADSFYTNCSPYSVTTGDGGIQFTSAGVAQTKETSTAFGTAPTGTLFCVAKRVRFNIAEGTSTIIGYMAVNGAVTSTPLTGKAIASYATTTTGYAILGGASGGASGSWPGSIYYVYREFIGISGRSDSEVLALVTQVYNAALSRWA